MLHQARDSFLELIQRQDGDGKKDWVEVETESDRMRLKSMFDTLIVSCCRGNMTDFGLDAFDVWRSVTWELEKDDSSLGMSLRLSTVTLAFLESCCRKEEKLEWRIFDVCAEMRRQQYNKKLVKKELSGRAPKISHHFGETEEEDAGDFSLDISGAANEGGEGAAGLDYVEMGDHTYEYETEDFEEDEEDWEGQFQDVIDDYET